MMIYLGLAVVFGLVAVMAIFDWIPMWLHRRRRTRRIHGMMLVEVEGVILEFMADGKDYHGDEILEVVRKHQLIRAQEHGQR